MQKSEAYVGQIVTISGSRLKGIAKVTKVAQKNLQVVTPEGDRWSVNPFFASPAPAGDYEEFRTAKSAADPKITLGSLVRFADMPKDLYVAIGKHSGLWRIARLGGDNGSYYRGISSDRLTVVNYDIEENTDDL